MTRDLIKAKRSNQNLFHGRLCRLQVVQPRRARLMSFYSESFYSGGNRFGHRGMAKFL